MPCLKYKNTPKWVSVFALIWKHNIKFLQQIELHSWIAESQLQDLQKCFFPFQPLFLDFTILSLTAKRIIFHNLFFSRAKTKKGSVYFQYHENQTRGIYFLPNLFQQQYFIYYLSLFLYFSTCKAYLLDWNLVTLKVLM